MTKETCQMWLKIMSVFFFSTPFIIPPWDNSDVVVDVRWSLLCPVQHCLHHTVGPLWPLLCPHSYTTQLSPLEPPETMASVVLITELSSPANLSVLWLEFKPTTSHQMELAHTLACTTTAIDTWTVYSHFAEFEATKILKIWGSYFSKYIFCWGSSFSDRAFIKV